MLCALFFVLVTGCKGKKPPHDATVAAEIRDARSTDASSAWPELAGFPLTEPVRVIPLPVQASTPRFDVGGPVLAGDVAIVSSSQFGFVAVDFRRGQIAWSKPAGLHVAPPLARGSDVILIGDCVNPPDIPEHERLLGCVRAVAPTGADLGYVAIHGRAKDLAPFAGAAGPQRVWATDDRHVTWRRGDQAVAVDVLSGAAAPAPATDPPLVVSYKTHTWQIALDDEGHIVAREHGRVAWHTPGAYTTLLGAVYLPEQSPMVRVSHAGAFRGQPELGLLDLDATGSLNGQASRPVPGISLVGHAIDVVGDVALAVRLDTSLERDFIAGYAANGLLRWVYLLPHVPRPDPVGLAIAPDAVIALHDGDTLTVLPDVSAPPTAPGAVRVPSENATP